MEWTGPDHPPKVNGQTLSSTLAQATQKKYTVKQPPEDPRTSEIIWMHLKREEEGGGRARETAREHARGGGGVRRERDKGRGKGKGLLQK